MIFICNILQFPGLHPMKCCFKTKMFLSHPLNLCIVLVPCICHYTCSCGFLLLFYSLSLGTTMDPWVNKGASQPAHGFMVPFRLVTPYPSSPLHGKMSSVFFRPKGKKCDIPTLSWIHGIYQGIHFISTPQPCTDIDLPF